MGKGKKGLHVYTRITIWCILGTFATVMAWIITWLCGDMLTLGLQMVAFLFIAIEFFFFSLGMAWIAPRMGNRAPTRRYIIAAVVRTIFYLAGFYGFMMWIIPGNESVWNPPDANNMWGSLNLYIAFKYMIVLILENLVIVGITYAFVH
jgi:hypothetical protein